MECTTQARVGAVVVVPAISVAPLSVRPSARVAASHLAGAVRLNGAGLDGVGRGTWRGQPSLGTPASISAAMPAQAVPAAPSMQARTKKLDRKVTKQFRTTVYEGPRPWQVPV